MLITRFSETSVSTYESTRRHNPKQQQQQRHIHRRENLKCHKLMAVSIRASDQITCQERRLQRLNGSDFDSNELKVKRSRHAP
jgi:hypothetical protein